MKIRNGFVSNSSSSSFIIGCKEIPNTLGDAMNIWFGYNQKSIAPDIISNMFNTFKEININREEVLNAIDDVVDNTSYSENDWNIKLCEEFHGNLLINEIYGENYNQMSTDYKDFLYSYPKASNSDEWKIQKKYFKTESYNIKLKNIINNFFDRFDGYILMEAEFSDGDSELDGRTEHGDHWQYFPVVEKFNHH